MNVDHAFIHATLDAAPSLSTASEVAHYTRIGALSDFFAGPGPNWVSAWAKPVQFLNDRMELRMGLRLFQEDITAGGSPAYPPNFTSVNALIGAVDSLDTDTFQLSFSGAPDDLGQWRGYGANGMGCSVVVDDSEVRRVADVAGYILYEDTVQRKFVRAVLDHLRKEPDKDTVIQTIVVAASFIKDRGFSSEKEFRLIVLPDAAEVKFRESGDRIVPYYDFLEGRKRMLPVTRIVIGPGWGLGLLDEDGRKRHHVPQVISRLLTARNMSSTSIGVSAIPYDPR